VKKKERTQGGGGFDEEPDGYEDNEGFSPEEDTQGNQKPASDSADY
jgi:hypothetical protein